MRGSGAIAIASRDGGMGDRGWGMGDGVCKYKKWRNMSVEYLLVHPHIMHATVWAVQTDKGSGPFARAQSLSMTSYGALLALERLEGNARAKVHWQKRTEAQRGAKKKCLSLFNGTLA